MKSLANIVFFKLTLFLVLGLSIGHAHGSSGVSKVIEHYLDIAHAVYEDSLISAGALEKAIDRLLENPTPATLDEAKSAWLAARVPYQQSEVFRFGNPVVDDWEGNVNAWPLDEGLIDYVQGSTESDNPFANANIIANKQLKIAGRQIDASRINLQLIQSLHEIGSIEANVATGYHAIEFLLWGQDLNGNYPGAGRRSHLDYDLKACAHTNCERRRAYLKTIARLLVADLRWITDQFAPDTGAVRTEFLELPQKEALRRILMGMGSLSYGELAGERMQLGLILGDPEEEHDCFSDNTHWSHYYNVRGIRNLYAGEYRRLDGSLVSGPGLNTLDRRNQVGDALDKTQGAFLRLVEYAENIMAYDQMITQGNVRGNQVISSAVEALLNQTQALEQLARKLGVKEIEFEGSDSLSGT